MLWFEGTEWKHIPSNLRKASVPGASWPEEDSHQGIQAWKGFVGRYLGFRKATSDWNVFILFQTPGVYRSGCGKGTLPPGPCCQLHMSTIQWRQLVFQMCCVHNTSARSSFCSDKRRFRRNVEGIESCCFPLKKKRVFLFSCYVWSQLLALSKCLKESTEATNGTLSCW